jgi:hypothetical protein
MTLTPLLAGEGLLHREARILNSQNHLHPGVSCVPPHCGFDDGRDANRLGNLDFVG